MNLKYYNLFWILYPFCSSWFWFRLDIFLDIILLTCMPCSFCFIVVQLLSCVRLFETPWTAACQTSLSFTISQSLLKFMSIEYILTSNHLILSPPSPPAALLLNPSVDILLDSWVGKIHWRRDRLPTSVFLGFLCSSAGKESSCNARNLGSIPELGRSPEEGKGSHSRTAWTIQSMGSQRVGHDWETHFQYFQF